MREQNMKSRIAVVAQKREVLMMLQKNLIYTSLCDLAIPDIQAADHYVILIARNKIKKISE